MLEISIARASPADGPELVRLIEAVDAETDFLGVPGERAVWADRAEETLKAIDEQGGATFLARTSGREAVGYLRAFSGGLARVRGTLFIATVGIREAYRGQGIGLRFFEAVETFARERDAWRLELRVDVGNARGLALYHRRGFSVEGRIRRAAGYPHGFNDHFWMGKLLRDLPPAGDARASVASVPPLEELVVRPVRPEDAEAVCAWEQRLLAENPFMIKRPEEVQAPGVLRTNIASLAANPHSCGMVAIDGGDVLGYGWGWIQPQFRIGHDANVGLSVLPGAEGRHIGRHLFAAVGAWAAGRGARRLTASVQARNARGIRFARACGFDEEARARNYERVGEAAADRLRFGKLLD
jgi:RimJ/RimL family protein N-acetyltransferase